MIIRSMQLFPFVRGELCTDIPTNVGGLRYITAQEARFTGTLYYLDWHLGSSGSLFYFSNRQVPERVSIDETPTYITFLFTPTNFAKLIPRMIEGVITGTFFPVKQGTRYSWKLEEE